MNQLIDIEQHINTLKATRVGNVKSIKNLEKQNEVINLELEKALIKKGKIIGEENIKEYFKGEL